ncbi:MAG: M12 family metallo-peptidase [Tahibacter sp.]
MKSFQQRLALTLVGSLLVGPAFAASTDLSAALIGQLRDLKPGDHALLTGFPVDEMHTASVDLERIDIYSPEARVIEVTAQGERDLPRSRLIFFLGATNDARARIGLSFDPDTLTLDATVRSSVGNYSVLGKMTGARMILATRAVVETDNTGKPLDFRCGQDKLDQSAIDAVLQRPPLTSPVEPSAIGGPRRKAVMAVDTDGELLNAPVFGGNTTTATNWIAQLFVQMNVLYERDFNTTLLQGTTFLNTNGATDPYTSSGSNTAAYLNEFGTYWLNNRGRVFRHFALLLSGKSGSPNSASGIAWIDAYCAKGTAFGGGNLFGSYSVNEIFTFAGTTATQNAPLVAHEIGHNFGAPHTHCPYATNGNAPLDQCYNGEAGATPACYAGTPACPSAANGSKGSLMSYCHVSGPSGANCGSNNYVLDYASTPANPVATQMNNRLTANFSTCIDVVFKDGNQ